MRMRMKAGTPVSVVVPNGVAGPAANDGLDMNVTFRNASGQPDQYDLFVDLGVGGTVDLFVWMKDAGGNWSIAADTGNLGQLGGQNLAAVNKYTFPVQGLATAERVYVQALNAAGGITFATKITPRVGGLEG